MVNEEVMKNVVLTTSSLSIIMKSGTAQYFFIKGSDIKFH
jgi:hypothetical protein